MKVDDSAKCMRLDQSGLYISFIEKNKQVTIYELAIGNKVYEFQPEFSSINDHSFS